MQATRHASCDQLCSMAQRCIPSRHQTLPHIRPSRNRTFASCHSDCALNAYHACKTITLRTEAASVSFGHRHNECIGWLKHERRISLPTHRASTTSPYPLKMGIVGSRAHPEVIAVSKQRNEGGGPSDAVQSTADECSSPVIEEEEEEDWSPNFRVSYLFDNLFVSGSDVPVPTARTRRRDALRPLITLFSLGSNSSRWLRFFEKGWLLADKPHFGLAKRKLGSTCNLLTSSPLQST